MRITARLRLFTMVGALLLLGGAARAQVEMTHFKASGARASLNSFNGTTAYDLSVNRDDSGTTLTTFLSFVTQQCDATFTVCSGVFGSGNIPNSDFNASTGTANLNTNLATNPGFQLINYVQDNANGTFTSSPAVRGIVNVNWKKVPRQSSSMTGTQTLVSGGFSTKFTGTQTSDSATATGTVLSAPLPAPSSGLISLAKSSAMVITRN